MSPRYGVSQETLELVYRANVAYADRHRAKTGRFPDGCLATEGTEAYHLATSAVGAVCNAIEEDYAHVVQMLKGAHLLAHFCLDPEVSCGAPPGSCVASDFGAFQAYLEKMAILRNNPAMEAALCTHAENMRHELAGYVAAWHPDHEYGVVMRACDNYIQSDATGTRLPEFDMGVDPSHNAKISRAFDCRDIDLPPKTSDGLDSHSKLISRALQARPYAVEKLMVWHDDEKTMNQLLIKFTMERAVKDALKVADKAARVPLVRKELGAALSCILGKDRDERLEYARGGVEFIPADLLPPDVDLAKLVEEAVDAPVAKPARAVAEDDEAEAEAEAEADNRDSKRKKRNAWFKGLKDYTPPFSYAGRVATACKELASSTYLWDDPKRKLVLGDKLFQREPAYARPHANALASMPLYLFRRYPKIVYVPNPTCRMAGGLPALANAIEAAHGGRAVGNLYVHGDSVGGWAPRLPSQLDSADYNCYIAPIGLEKQIEFDLPLLKLTEDGNAKCTATRLETAACAQPLLQFASTMLKPQVLLSFVPVSGTITLNHREYTDVGRKQLAEGDATTTRDFGYSIDGSPETATLYRESLRILGAGMERALQVTFNAFCDDKKRPNALDAAKMAVAYATAERWRDTPTAEGAITAHWIAANGSEPDDLPDTSNARGHAFVVGRLASFLWRHVGVDDPAALLELVSQLDTYIPKRAAKPLVIHYAGIWVQQVPEREAVYKRRAAAALLGIFFDCGPNGQWWPTAVDEAPGGGQRLPMLRDLHPFHTADDATIGILGAEVVTAESRVTHVGLLRVPFPSENGFSVIISGHSHCSFTDGNRFVAAAAASALAGRECRLVTAAEAAWEVREPTVEKRISTRTTPLVTVISNTLYHDPDCEKTLAAKVPFVGVLAYQHGDAATELCYYRVLRCSETLSREREARRTYELGTDKFNPPPWERAAGTGPASNHGYLDGWRDADDPMAMEVDVLESKLVPGDHPPLVSGADFSPLFRAAAEPLRGMAALQPGDSVYLSLHDTASWPKGITAAVPAVEATHAVLIEAGAEPPARCAPLLNVPATLKALPPAARRTTPVLQFSAAQHRDVVASVYSTPKPGAPVTVDSFNTLLCVLARSLRARVQGKTAMVLEGLQGCGKTVLMDLIVDILFGANCSRRVRDLAKQVLEDQYFQETINTLLLVTDELDESFLQTSQFKELVDAAYSAVQRKYSNGNDRHQNHWTLLAAFNPTNPNARHVKRVMSAVIDILQKREMEGRRVLHATVANTLASAGVGRKPGGEAGARFIRSVFEDSRNPYIMAAVYNYLTTEVQVGESFNLQQLGGSTRQEIERLSAIRFDNTQEYWVEFSTWFAQLPEAQVPEVDADYRFISASDEEKTGTWAADTPLDVLSFDHHGLFGAGGKFNLKPGPAAKKASDNDKALHLSRIAGGLLEHGWHDGIALTTALLAVISDAWYKNHHSHVETAAKNTISGKVFKDLLRWDIISTSPDGTIPLTRKDIADKLKAAGKVPPLLTRLWYDITPKTKNNTLLTTWWTSLATPAESFRTERTRSFPAFLRLVEVPAPAT